MNKLTKDQIKALEKEGVKKWLKGINKLIEKYERLLAGKTSRARCPFCRVNRSDCEGCIWFILTGTNCGDALDAGGYDNEETGEWVDLPLAKITNELDRKWAVDSIKRLKSWKKALEEADNE